MKLKRISKVYSGVSEVMPSGVSYYSSQVITDYALDPLDKTLDYIDNTKIGKLESVKKKTSRFAGIVKPLKRILARKRKKDWGQN